MRCRAMCTSWSKGFSFLYLASRVKHTMVVMQTLAHISSIVVTLSAYNSLGR